MEIKPCSPEQWDAFVDRSPQGTVFNKSFFINSYRVNHSGKSAIYLLCYKGNEEVAGFAGVLGREGLEALDYRVYNGIIFKDLTGVTPYRVNETVFQVTEAFANHLFQYKEVNFSNHWDVKEMRAFDWVNYHDRSKGYYQIIPRYTSLLDISSPGEGYDSGRRIPEIDKGKKEGHVFELKETDDIRLLSRFVQMNFVRQGLSLPHDERMDLVNICKSLLANKAAKMFATHMNGQPASISLFAYDKHRAYYLFNGTDTKFRDWGVGTKNIYESCTLLNQELGLKELDMVGVNSPKRGSYKLSFGGSLTLYFQIKKMEGQ